MMANTSTIVPSNTTSLNEFNASVAGDEIEPFTVYEEWEAITFAVFLFMFCIFGLFANGLTFIAIWISPKLHNTVFNIFLLSLCVSDFLSAIDSLGVLYRRTWGFRYWALPSVLCKLTLGVELWTTVATMQHIVAFCILRLISLQFPTRFSSIRPHHAKIMVTVLWLETFFSGFVPFFLFPGVNKPPEDISKPYWYSCTMQKEWFPDLKMYSNIAFPLLLYTPLALVVVLCLWLIVLILKRRYNSKFSQTDRTATTKKENFALLQLGLIAFSFLLGYIPDFAYRMYSLRTRTSGGKLTGHSEWLLSLLCHSLLRFSECLNPVFYNIASSQTRRATFALLNSCRGNRRTTKVSAVSAPPSQRNKQATRTTVMGP